ncbi:auxin transporter-like protein 1 [Aristolochia californica]|uniref:auxin transporter-like protein 1 n=1 Tax=Aristolochia californica TaxID=171875 RepID=UPI0035E25548
MDVKETENGALQITEETTNQREVGEGRSFKDVWNAVVWHGGSVFDAWLNVVAAQVGSLILTLPYTFAQMGFWFGVCSQFLYGAFGCWTVYILNLFYAEASRRTRTAGIIHERHILQYHEVISIVAGSTLGKAVLVFNMTAQTFTCVLQLIACSSHIYYMNSNWNKREWLYLFGALALPIVLLPSVHNFRLASILGIATTSITSAYMTVAAIQHGQVGQVRHQGPKNLVEFFTGATNILFSYGSHGLCIELMEAMWKPQKYKFVYIYAVLYTYLLTIPDSVSVYWAYGDILLHRSNAFAVLPPSKAKNVCIIAMILHQYVAFLLNVNPIFLAWEKLVGVHLSERFLLKAVARIPVVLVIWFLALAIPFFGPINSIMGAFLFSFSVYIIPSVAFMKAYSRKEFSPVGPETAMYGHLTYWISAFVAVWVFVFGFGFGGFASGTMFVRQIQSFGFFDKCYQCPPKPQ